MRLEPNESGHYPCPHCNKILTAIVKTWLPGITDYICHSCKKGFKVRNKSQPFFEVCRPINLCKLVNI